MLRAEERGGVQHRVVLHPDDHKLSAGAALRHPDDQRPRRLPVWSLQQQSGTTCLITLNITFFNSLSFALTSVLFFLFFRDLKFQVHMVKML